LRCCSPWNLVECYKPGGIAAEIVEDLQSALAEFTELAESRQSIGVVIESEE
jgi:hypothetical protein